MTLPKVTQWALLWGFFLFSAAPLPLPFLAYQPALFALTFYKILGLGVGAAALLFLAPRVLLGLFFTAACACLGPAPTTLASLAPELSAPLHSAGLVAAAFLFCFSLRAPLFFSRLQQGPALASLAALTLMGGLWVFYNGAAAVLWSWDPVEATSIAAPGFALGSSHFWAKSAPSPAWAPAAFGAARLFRLGAALSAHHLLFICQHALSGLSSLALLSKPAPGMTPLWFVAAAGSLLALPLLHAQALALAWRRCRAGAPLTASAALACVALLSWAAPATAFPLLSFTAAAGCAALMAINTSRPFSALAFCSPHFSALGAAAFLAGFCFLAPAQASFTALALGVAALHSLKNQPFRHLSRTPTPHTTPTSRALGLLSL